MDRVLGFVGIGLMGRPMVERLLGHGFEVRVWNRTPEKARGLVDRGASVEESLESLVSNVDAILLCVSDTAAVVEVAATIESRARVGQLVVDFSSIEPVATRRLAASLASRGVSWVDAPVSGGVDGAEHGTLAIMAGGELAAVERARTICVPLGRRFTRVGEVGAGQVAKICNQMIVACNAMVLAEVVAFAESAGVDASLLPEALEGGFADSLPFRLLVPRMATRTFEPVRWKVRTLLKDLDMAVALSQELGSPTPLSGTAAQLFRTHARKGHGSSDPSTLVTMYTEDE